VADWAEDKATMHLELINAGLVTPQTIILSPYNEQPNLPTLDLQGLGTQFVVKPSYGGGGEGVVMGATSMDQVRTIRRQYPHLKYLLQQTIIPQQLDGRDAWFRVIFCDDRQYLCWWDPNTHVYTPVSEEEELRFGLTALQEVTTRIAELCKLVFFSTEIALSLDGQWVVIDYVNDQIDLRLKSQAFDGVPDELVEKISRDLACLVSRRSGCFPPDLIDDDQ
jgi:glutathione synthase/RimK-type ligase-like ATP-grasp enzyme